VNARRGKRRRPMDNLGLDIPTLLLGGLVLVVLIWVSWTVLRWVKLLWRRAKWQRVSTLFTILSTSLTHHAIENRGGNVTIYAIFRMVFQSGGDLYIIE
jgi:hypothetical protein